MNVISSVKFYHILTCDIHDYVRFQKEKKLLISSKFEYENYLSSP